MIESAITYTGQRVEESASVHQHHRAPTRKFSLAVLAKRSCGVLLGAAALMMVHLDVVAQEGSLGENGASIQVQRRIDEIIVTAQKREQPLQTVAAAVTALDRDFIEKSGIKDVADAGLFAPGTVVSTNGTSGRVYIRGVGNNLDFLGSQGAVAVHVDGVYQSRQWGVFYDFIDVERIEILRGPQGTLYGRNATGGVINIISAAPTEDLSTSASIAVGSFDELKLSAMTSSSLTDGVLGRLAISRKTRDGYTENLFPGSRDLGDEDLVAARGELEISTSERFELRLIGQYFTRDTAGTAIVPTVDGLAAALGAQSNIDPFKVRHNSDLFFEADSRGLTAIAKWRLGQSLTVESVSAFGDNVVHYHLDTDGTEVDAVSFRNREDHQQWSQELRLYDDANESQWSWQAGLFYLGEDTSDTGVVFLPALDTDIPVGGAIDVEAFAVFAQATRKLSEKHGVTFGLRYNTERKTMNSPVYGDDSARWKDWTPHVALEYALSDDAFFYTSITKGFKSGGYNVLGGGEQVGPEQVWSFEAGSKTNWLDDRLRVNGVLYYSRYDDQQVNTFTGAGLARIDNAAKSTVYGVELEAYATPTAASELGVSLSYLHAVFDEYLAADPFLGAIDLAGSRLSHAPRFSATFSADYALPLKIRGTMTAHVDYAWQDGVKYDVFDNASTSQGAYGVVNTGIWYTGVNGNWKMGLWIRNVADTVYFTSHAKLNFTPDGTVSFTGRPRTYGVELSFDY